MAACAVVGQQQGCVVHGGEDGRKQGGTSWLACLPTTALTRAAMKAMQPAGAGLSRAHCMHGSPPARSCRPLHTPPPPVCTLPFCPSCRSHCAAGQPRWQCAARQAGGVPCRHLVSCEGQGTAARDQGAAGKVPGIVHHSGLASPFVTAQHAVPYPHCLEASPWLPGAQCATTA